MNSIKFTDRPIFKKMVRNIFQKVDVNKNGEIDSHEFMLAMAMLKYKVAQNVPGLVAADLTDPAKAIAKMAQYDTNKSGTLTEDEFFRLARDWFEKDGSTFLARIITTTFISMVVLPESAAILHRELPAARNIPKKVFAVLFGLVFKFCAAHLGRA